MTLVKMKENQSTQSRKTIDAFDTIRAYHKSYLDHIQKAPRHKASFTTKTASDPRTCRRGLE